MEEKDAKSIWKGIKRIRMVDMANKVTRKQANKWEDKQVRKQTKGGVRKGQM